MAQHRKNLFSILPQVGFTVLELIVVIGLVTILSGIGVYSLKKMSDPLGNAAFAIEQLMHKARALALSNTEVVQIRPLNSNMLGAFTGDSCKGTLLPLSSHNLKLPAESSLAGTSWSVCFDQRGLADSNVSFQVRDTQMHRKTIRIALGGGTKIDT